jgi:hypothetical protein
MITRLELLESKLAEGSDVEALTGGKVQSAEAEPYLVIASELVETVAGPAHAARHGRFLVEELAPQGYVWTLPLFPVLTLTKVQRRFFGGTWVDLTPACALANDCQIVSQEQFSYGYGPGLAQLQAEVTAGWTRTTAPFPVRLAVATVVDLLISKAAVGPREVSMDSLKIMLPTLRQAVMEALGAH